MLREHDGPPTITVPPSASSGARPAPRPGHGALWLPIFLLLDNETQEWVLVSTPERGAEGFRRRAENTLQGLLAWVLGSSRRKEAERSTGGSGPASSSLGLPSPSLAELGGAAPLFDPELLQGSYVRAFPTSRPLLSPCICTEHLLHARHCSKHSGQSSD